MQSPSSLVLQHYAASYGSLFLVITLRKGLILIMGW